MTECDPYDLVDRTISDTFRVDEFVAEGGYGVVYRAFHKHFRSPIALKVLKVPDGLSEPMRTHSWEEFRREAEVQFRLSALTGYVVRPLHIGQVTVSETKTLPVMALEWLEGMNLDDEAKVRRQAGLAPLPLAHLLDRLGGAAQAIHLSHNFEREGGRYSVVHRDIKPENLFVTKMRGREVVKVLDFGTSKVGRMMDLLAGDLVRTGGPGQFSPAYGAPEQWMPDSLGQTGPWTDVWGLALTLVELMKGEHVFSGNRQRVMFQCLSEQARPTPRSHGIAVSDEVEEAFRRALAVDPRDRTKSVRDLWLDLRAALATGTDAPPVSFGARDEGPPSAVSDSEIPFVLERPSVRPKSPPIRGRPRTGTFPVAGAFQSSDESTRRTGTDGTPRDTIPEPPREWKD